MRGQRDNADERADDGRAGSAVRNSVRACRRSSARSSTRRRSGEALGDRGCDLRHGGGGLKLRRARSATSPATIAPNSATYCSASTPGTRTPTMTLTKADEAQQRHRADQAEQRQRAALPRGLRRAEEGEGEDDECERIKRRRQTIVQLRSVLAGLRRVERVVGARPQQLPKVLFAIVYVDAVLRAPPENLRQIERVAIERHDARIALARLRGVERCPLRARERSRCRSSRSRPARRDRWRARSDRAGRRGRCRPGGRSAGGRAMWNVRLPPIVVKRPGCTMLVRMSARTCVGPVAQRAQAPRRDIGGDHRDQERNHERRRQGTARTSRHGETPAAFITMISEFGAELVEDVGGRQHQRDRRDHHDQAAE